MKIEEKIMALPDDVAVRVPFDYFGSTDDLKALVTRLTTAEAKAEAYEAALEHYADKNNWSQQPGTSCFAQYVPNGWITESGFNIARAAFESASHPPQGGEVEG